MNCMQCLCAASLFVSVSVYAQESGAKADPPPAEATKAPVKKGIPKLFRGGTIYSAEISRVKPDFQNEVFADQPQFENPVWAEIQLKFPKNRGISRFDYVLETASGEYRCVAIAEDDKTYSQKKEDWTFAGSKTSPDKYYRILFAVPAADVKLDDPETVIPLKFKLMPTKFNPPNVSFRILPEDVPFTKTSAQPPDGSYTLFYFDLHPEKAPSLDAPAAPVESESPKEEEAPAAE